MKSNCIVKPTGKIDVVIDTDTFNEIDDQFALALLIKSNDTFNTKAIHAAPFFNMNSLSPADGMEKSYNEIFNILSLAGFDELGKNVKKGSDRYLIDETNPVDSDAAVNLVQLAMQYTKENPLYVIAIGAVTNVASAILMNRDIIDRIVLVWLGGHAHHWPDTREFNMAQDVAAARVVFGCGCALVQLPCMGVVSAFTTTGAELQQHLKGKNALCNYLVDHTIKTAIRDSDMETWSRPIWDVTAVGWLLNGDYMLDYLVPSPIPQYDHHYSFDHNRHAIRYVYHIHRDALFKVLFDTLAQN